MSRAIDAATSPGLAGDAPETSLNGIQCDKHPAHEANNFIWLTIHQVMVRIGWVFKTESIIMPFFMDTIGGGPVLRGSLMVFNRVGFSLLPVLFARRLKLMPQKRWELGIATLSMAGPFASLSFVWWSGVWREADGEPVWWMPYFFLIIYGIFFAITGINQLAAHSIQGKLIAAERRGRLFAASVLFGAPAAIGCAWWLMPRWLALPDKGFTLLFAAPAVMFAIASLAMLGIREPRDQFEEPSMSAWHRLRDTWRLMLHDESLRGVAITALLYSTTFTLFPHYQALARQQATESTDSGFDLQSLMVWTVVQHTAVAILSLLAGPLADRFGTRLSVRLTVLGAALAPLTAIALSMLSPETMVDWFWIVFLPIGFTPVTIKMLINYTLELVDREDHPRYISAIGMCLALPVIVGSPLVGCLVRLLGCVPVFALGAAVMLAAGVQTLRLQEPRHG